MPDGFELCTRVVRPGGHVADVGVHGRPVTLHLEDPWIRDVTITTGLVDTSSTPAPLKTAVAETGAFKVVLGGEQREPAVPAA